MEVYRTILVDVPRRALVDAAVLLMDRCTVAGALLDDWASCGVAVSVAP